MSVAKIRNETADDSEAGDSEEYLMTNRLELSGIICRTPIRKVSPSGIPHCQLCLSIVQCRRKPVFTGRHGVKCRYISGHQNQAIITV
ncbi:Primosomal replication protein n [Raoultella terrigena]|uniref:Primosomal replication protein n n=1 Tax=Raoultella terrigena TaxID=577 RepID=A0A4U9D7H1_RAOTE|nr:Primosomal replication protein n [Raoultella terrigena]